VAHTGATLDPASSATSESGFDVAKSIDDAFKAKNWEVLIAYAQIVSTHIEENWSISRAAPQVNNQEESRIISCLMDSVYERVCGPAWKQLSAGVHGPMNYGEMGPK
jgi:hypothetical protein